MKNLARLFGITVLIGLLVTACPTGGGDVGDEVPNSSCPLGPTLTLSGQVHTMSINGGTATAVYPPIQSNLSINDGGLGGNGSVTDGQLSFTIETPISLKSVTELMLGEAYINLQISPADARGVGLNLEITGNPNYNILSKMNVVSITMTGQTSMMITQENVGYIYVDRDVTMTGTGTTSRPAPPLTTLVTSDINISLKKGWNAMYTKSTTTTNDAKPQNTQSITSAADPSHLKWLAMKAD